MKKAIVVVVAAVAALAAQAQVYKNGVPWNAPPWGLAAAAPTAGDDGKCWEYDLASRSVVWATCGGIDLTATQGALLYGHGATPAWTVLSAGMQGQVLAMGATEPGWVATVALGTSQITVAATGDLSAAQVRGTVINTLGQSAAEVLTLPASAEGYAFTLSAVATGNSLSIAPHAGEVIYLDGTALTAGHKVTITTPAVSNSITCWSLKTAATPTWGWVCQSGSGLWADGGA